MVLIQQYRPSGLSVWVDLLDLSPAPAETGAPAPEGAVQQQRSQQQTRELKGGSAAVTVIGVLVFAVAAGFAVIVVATIVVIIGIRQEERRKTILGGHRPPTACALLARWVLGAHFYLIPEERPEADEGPGEEPPWFERPSPPASPVGPRGR